jgi:hypothetical protein
MKHLDKNNKKKNNTRVATLAVLVATVVVVTGPATIIGISQSADAVHITAVERFQVEPEAPSVVTGDNIYIAWWNGTAGEPDVQTDVMFRASNDGGATFGDKINLSNTTDADSWRVELHGEGDTVVVSWWETNQTSDTPVARVSNDAGETFGPLMMLAANGTLGSGEAEEIGVAGDGEEGDVEGAVEEAAAGEDGGG